MYAFLAHVIDWGAQARAQRWTPYVASSRARSLVEVHASGLKRAGIPIPTTTARGADYLNEFSSLLKLTARWISRSL